jgi:predicted deacylase
MFPETLRALSYHSAASVSLAIVLLLGGPTGAWSEQFEPTEWIAEGVRDEVDTQAPAEFGNAATGAAEELVEAPGADREASEPPVISDPAVEVGEQPGADPVVVDTGTSAQTQDDPTAEVASEVAQGQDIRAVEFNGTHHDALVLVPIDLGDLDEGAETTPDGVIHLLGESVQPGTTRRLSWSSADLFEGLSTTTPVMVVNGVRPGPTLCLTAAVHGDELNGIEMVRRIIHELDPAELSGAVIGVPVVNLHGFRRATRYLPDRRDLNRYFPGNPGGSSAARIAHAFFTEVVVHCNALVDLHTGSFHRTNLPQLRADLGNPQVVELTGGFGNLVVVHSRAAAGTLRRAAMDIGIPAVTMEAGEPMRLQPEEVAHGVQGIRGLLNSLQMVQNRRLFTQKPPVFYSSRWVRADHGGMLLATVQPGDQVREGQQLGTVTDPVTNRIVRIVAPTDGRVIGMALNQVIMPGFATFHLGLDGRAPTSNRSNSDEAELALRRPNGLQGPEPDEDYAGAEPGPEETWPSDPEYDN